jgi:hypothetical protein
VLRVARNKNSRDVLRNASPDEVHCAITSGVCIKFLSEWIWQLRRGWVGGWCAAAGDGTKSGNTAQAA